MITHLPSQFTTTLLQMDALSGIHAPFIYELLNTPGWLANIGNRNIHNLADAENYITRINAMPQVQYWVVSQQCDGLPIGVITLIKRDYLAHHDIGFAFLPAAQGKGLAFEAAQHVLHHLHHNHQYHILLATTIPTNTASIKLLTKLGFAWQRQITMGGMVLEVYRASVSNV